MERGMLQAFIAGNFRSEFPESSTKHLSKQPTQNTRILQCNVLILGSIPHFNKYFKSVSH
jgi:hypothetical protein